MQIFHRILYMRITKIIYWTRKNHISKVIETDIAKIISEEPSFGGKWFVTKIRFISPSLVSVEYEDGHNSSTAQIRIIKPKETFKFEEVQ